MNGTQTPYDGVLLVGHGTRDSVGCGEFLADAAMVAQRLDPVPVEPAFLELAEPGLSTGLSRLAGRGARRVRVAPLMLFAAGHMKEDIPATLGAAAEGLPLEIASLAGHLGCSRSLLELSAIRYWEAWGRKKACGPISLAARDGAAATNTIARPPPNTALVMIGRGSGDLAAIDEFWRFTAMRKLRTPVASVHIGFAAVAEPSLPEALAEAAATAAERIVVQPHLIFRGRVIEEIEREVGRYALSEPGRWVVAPRLGVHPLLVDAIRERVTR